MKLTTLANELNISSSYLSEVESGKKKPSLELIEKYSEIFNINKSSIIFFSEELNQLKGRDLVKSARKKMIKLLQIIEKGFLD